MSAAGVVPRLGLRENLPQFALLVVVNARVGAMLGMERSLVPTLAGQVFHLAAHAAVMSFIAVFGVSKAMTNLIAGEVSERVGRKRVLVAGWLLAAPVPWLLMWAPSWSWILVANLLLGVSQGLTWSTTVVMKVDLAGPRQRGLAMGLNEFAGYGAVAASAWMTGWVAARWGLRPQPFYLGVLYVAAGLFLSTAMVRETLHHARQEGASSTPASSDLSPLKVFWRTTVQERSLSAVTQAGFVNNLNDGMAWGLFPVIFTTAGLSLT